MICLNSALLEFDVIAETSNQNQRELFNNLAVTLLLFSDLRPIHLIDFAKSLDDSDVMLVYMQYIIANLINYYCPIQHQCKVTRVKSGSNIKWVVLSN